MTRIYTDPRHRLIIWLVTIGICFSISVSTFLARRTPLLSQLPKSFVFKRVKQHLLLPALFRTRHLNPLPYNMGYLPNRPLSLFITLYIILNIIFCCVSYPLALPNTWWTTERRQIAAYVGNRTGVLSFANLGIAILFAGRNNLLISLTGWSQTTFLTFHRWASRVATVQAIVHSIIYTVTYFWDGGVHAYYAEVAKAYYWWGIIATVALGLMLGLAVLPLRLGMYELFLVTHIVLAIMALVGSWYHVDLRYSKQWGYEVWLYLCFAFWGFDRLARVVRVLLFNNWERPSRSSVNNSSRSRTFLTDRARVERIPDTDIVQLTLFPGQLWAAAIKPGMHTFLYFPLAGKFWESHPFTIADWGMMSDESDNDRKERATSSTANSNQGTGAEKSAGNKTVHVVTEAAYHDRLGGHTPISHGNSCTLTQGTGTGTTTQAKKGKFYLRFLLRVQQGTTKSLLRSLGPSDVVHHHKILTEGPYAGHSQTLYPLITADTVLCIAGGIGVTFALGFVKQYLEQQAASSSLHATAGRSRRLMQQTTRFVLAWSAREEGLIRHVETMLAEQTPKLTSSNKIEFRIWWTDDANQHPTGTEKEVVEAKELAAQSMPSPTHNTNTATGHSGPSCSLPYTKTLKRSTRMPIAHVVNSALEVGRRTAVLVCAPGAMADNVRRTVAEVAGQGFDVDLLEEAFAW